MTSPPTVRVLVSSAGRRVELLTCLRESARELGLDAVIVATDCEPSLSPACHLADVSVAVPPASDPTFVAATAAVTMDHSIDILVPTNDLELVPLAEGRAEIDALGVSIAISSLPVLRVTRDKAATIRALHGHVRTPLTVETPIPDDVELALPLIAKPTQGSSSVGVRVLERREDVRALPPNYVVQARERGSEHTVNCYVDRAGRLLASVPHRRLATRSGEVSKAQTVTSEALQVAATGVVDALPDLRGPFCFQAFLHEGIATVIEVNGRFGGGYPLAHRAGAPFTEWLLREHLDLPVTPTPWRAGVTMLRYDQSVFVP